MADSLRDFGARMESRSSRLGGAVNALVKRMAEVIVDEVVLGTPVDTGEARSNWLVSLGVPITGTIAPYFPGKHLGLNERSNAAAAINRAQGPIDGRLPGQTLIIQNNVGHIGRLNNGTSQQAPALFVQKGVAAGIRSLDGQTLNL